MTHGVAQPTHRNEATSCHRHSLLQLQGKPTKCEPTIVFFLPNVLYNTMIIGRPSEDPVVSFPVSKLKSLMAKISNPRWVVPVLPEQELECLLNAAIELTQAGELST